MRVLHWYANFLGGGGVANAVLGLARAQADLGAEVAIASAETQGKPLYQPMQLSGPVRLFCWVPRWNLQFGALRLREISREVIEQTHLFNPDVVHIHGEFNPDNLRVPRIFDVPVILSPHGAFHPVAVGKSNRSLKKVYVAIAKRFLYHRVHAFHALSPAEADHIRTLLGFVNVYTLPQGAGLHIAQFLGAPKCREQRDEVRFIFVGRLDVYTKGLDILLEAFAEAVRALPQKHLHLTVVGPDWKGSLARLKEQVHKLGCGSKVTFTGAMPGDQVAISLMQSDVYVHLSRHEGFPLSVAEALLIGKPAILSCEIGTVTYPEIASLPYVKVISPNKREATLAMLHFSETLSELMVLASECREQVRQFFDWRGIAEAHLEYYGYLISRGL